MTLLNSIFLSYDLTVSIHYCLEKCSHSREKWQNKNKSKSAKSPSRTEQVFHFCWYAVLVVPEDFLSPDS